MATILQFPSGLVLEADEARDSADVPRSSAADGGIEAIVDLTHYQFLSDEPHEQGADVYLLVRR